MENIIELYNISYDIKSLCHIFPSKITIGNIPIVRLYNDWFDYLEIEKNIPQSYKRSYLGYLYDDIFIFGWDAPQYNFEKCFPFAIMNTRTLKELDYDESFNYNFIWGVFRDNNYIEMKKIYSEVCDLYFI
jgi:hypothetical protein